ncbi:MAG: hypothetical protein ACI9TV_002713 [Sulfurimonas sp.]|jgi:hypothetical protein|uniref:hypothetical protein n=1 Tax=Sulfurimonas sp. TaxID=2022749 RepID=UPI0039E533A2
MPSKITYIPILIVILIYFFFKPLIIVALDAYASHGLKQKVEFTKLDFFPFNFDGVITTKKFPQGVEVHGVYRDKRMYMTSSSLGGLITIIYKDHRYQISVDSVDLKTFVELLGSKKYVQSGVINGTAYYDKRPRSGFTKLKVSDAVLHGLDLDKQLATINDALHLDFANVISRAFIDNNTSGITKIDHLQFNVTLRHDNITSTDFALRTENYRLSIGANVHKKGPIEYFDVNLLDENGCAVITQLLVGDIRKPKVKETTTELVNIARSVPSSMFGMGTQIMKYANKQNFIQDKNMMGTKQMMLEADHYMQETSEIIMPLDCSVVYNGMVKHPEGNQKDSRNSSKFYLP